MEKETRGRPKVYKTKKQREKAVIASSVKWRKSATKLYGLRCYIKTDGDIIAKLDSLENHKAEYIKNLIREDIKKENSD